MTREYIQGWRVGITDHPGRRELEIEGPGELHIVIRKFKTSNFYQENYIGYMEDGSFDEVLICTYICPGGTSLYQEDAWQQNSDINLEIFYLSEPPHAYLYIGCAHWFIPVAFAEKLFSVFQTGEVNACPGWTAG